jgi:ribosome-associated translation inhibitor RaiA
MEIYIKSSSFNLTRSLRHHVEEQIVSNLGRTADRVKRVYVRLSDINGTHGGTDKRCHLHLSVPDMADVVIQNTQENLHDAISLASTRARTALNRKLNRQKMTKLSSLAMFRDSLLLKAS